MLPNQEVEHLLIALRVIFIRIKHHQHGVRGVKTSHQFMKLFVGLAGHVPIMLNGEGDYSWSTHSDRSPEGTIPKWRNHILA